MAKEWWFWVSEASLEKNASAESCAVFKKSAAEKTGTKKVHF
jgi:hypothetical protein